MEKDGFGRKDVQNGTENEQKTGFKLLASPWYSSAVSIPKPIDAPSITKAFWKKKTGIQSSFFQHSKVLLQLSWRDLKFLIKQNLLESFYRKEKLSRNV